MATITYHLSTKVNDLKRAEIYIRFSAGREKRYRTKSRIFIPVNRFSPKKSIIIPKIETDERQELLLSSEKLESLKKYILSQFEKTDINVISKKWLDNCVEAFYNPNSVDKSNIFTVFEIYMKESSMSDSFNMNVRTTFEVLYRFFEYHNIKKNFQYFDENKVSLLEEYLRTEYLIYYEKPELFKILGKRKRPLRRGTNTITTMFNRYGTFFNWCINREYTTFNPFKHYNISESYGRPFFLTIQERDRIYNFDFSDKKKLEIQRDIFIFHCVIGCRVRDLLNMTPENVIENAIEYIPRKTKGDKPTVVRVPLNKIASELIEKYKGGKKLFPFLGVLAYNNNIKKICKLAGIDRVVTVIDSKTGEELKKKIYEVASSHMARRTFIGNLYKNVKDPNLIGSLTGHVEGSKSFARYRDIDEDMKVELVNLLA